MTRTVPKAAPTGTVWEKRSDRVHGRRSRHVEVLREKRSRQGRGRIRPRGRPRNRPAGELRTMASAARREGAGISPDNTAAFFFSFSSNSLARISASSFAAGLPTRTRYHFLVRQVDGCHRCLIPFVTKLAGNLLRVDSCLTNRPEPRTVWRRASERPPRSHPSPAL